MTDKELKQLRDARAAATAGPISPDRDVAHTKFAEVAWQLVPDLLDTLAAAQKRIVELEAQVEAYEACDMEPGTWTVIDLRTHRVVPHPIRDVTFSPPERSLA